MAKDGHKQNAGDLSVWESDFVIVYGTLVLFISSTEEPKVLWYPGPSLSRVCN
jgi:hypothetical protein